MSYLFGGSPFDGYGCDGRRSLNMGGDGGGGGSTSSTTQTSNIPDWMRPQVETLLGSTMQQMYNVDSSGNVTGFKPFVPYSTNPADYVAGFSPMQNQAFQSAANLQTPGQFGYGSDLASAAGEGALGSTDAAYGYGQAGYNIGQQGANIGQGALGYGGAAANTAAPAMGYGSLGAQYGAAGQGFGANAASMAPMGYTAGSRYNAEATNPYAQQAFMSPYIQNALQPQLEEMQRQYNITGQQQRAKAAASGAFGGSRDALMQSENERNKNMAMNQAIGQGYQNAFQQAQQAQQFGANLGLQGLQAGTQAQQAGIQGAQAGMQGAQVGLQGVQGAQAGYGLGLQGIQGALAGNAQALQGAQAGLQGVQAAQAGYNAANQAAANMGQLGTQQLAAEQAIINQQNSLGGQQQANEQQIINQAIQNYANAQQNPQQQAAFFNSLVRGYYTPTTTTQNYQAAPNTMSQIAGAGLTGAAAYNMMKKKGGVIKSRKDGIDTLGIYNAMKGD